MKQVTDIAIFKIKDGSNKQLLLQDWTNFLSTKSGFISRKVYCSSKDVNTIMDIIEWSSAEEGDKAFANMTESDDFVVINSMIESLTITERFLILQN